MAGPLATGAVNARPLRLAILGDIAHVNVQRWCQGLAQAGAEVHVLSLAAAESKFWRLHHLTGRGHGKLRYLTTVPTARRMIAAIKPDVVAAYYVTGYGTLGAWLGFRPLVQMTSGSDVLIAPQQPVMRQLVLYNLSRAQLVTAWAPHMAEAARRLGVPDERLFVLPRGIPTAEFTAQHCPEPAADQVVRLICTRSLKPIYRIDVLIRAAAKLAAQGCQYPLTLAGDGSQRPYLTQLAQALGVASVVQLVGFVANSHLPQELARHHIYLALTPSDGVSASLLEAMAVGLLPIVPDNAANRYWVTSGENGLLLSDLDADTVAAAIVRGAEDVDLRRRAWGQNPARVADQADWRRNAAQYVARFRQLADDTA